MNYVVGDIQGCYKGLKKLLKKVSFNPNRDKLWAVGDLIARGEQSLETLEFLYDLGDSFDTVLGNHDLHLIASAHGIAKIKTQDKLEPLVNSSRFSTYIDWLRTKPLALSIDKHTLISHAGIYPSWSIAKALKLSNEFQSELAGKDYKTLLKKMYGNQPDQWSNSLKGAQRHRFIVNAFSRMRYIGPKNSLEFNMKSHPDNAPKDLTPWFMCKNDCLTKRDTILFGHWASLNGEVPNKLPIKAKVIALDTGYVWGNCMSLYCVEDKITTRQFA